MNIPLLLATLFFFAYTIYLFMAVTILEVSYKSNLNKLFIAICFCLSIWSLGFSITISAPSAEVALMWSRFASIGWTMIYATLLHFTVVLTDNIGKNRLLKIVLMYIPAFICLYGFALSPAAANSSYELVKTNAGWVNISENTMWDNIFYIYYTIYIVLSIALMLIWGRKDSANKKQIKYIFASLIVASVIGSITDIVFIEIADTQIPQLGPLFILVPILAAFTSIKKFNFLHIDSFDEQDLILSDVMRKRVYTFLSIYLIFSSIVNIFSYTEVYGEDSMIIVIMSILLFTSGIFIFTIQNLRTSNAIKDNVVMLVIYMFIHLSAVYSVDRSATTTWAAPVIIVILFVVFNNKRIIGFLTTGIIVSQVITWSYAPNSIVEINHWDHLARMAIYIVVILLASLTNKLYIKRLKDNKRQIETQKLIGQISSEFVSARLKNYDQTINETLEKLGGFYNLDCISLVIFDYNNRKMVDVNEWLSNDYINDSSQGSNISFEKADWWINQFLNNDMIVINSLIQVPRELEFIKDFLDTRGVKSILALPIHNQKNIFGFISFEDRVKEREWDDIDINNYNIIANIIGDTLAKMDSESKQYELAYYDSLTGLPNRTLFNQKLQTTIDDASRHESKFVLYFLDLDDFKIVNDTVGHEAGDYLLKHVANKIKECFSKDDIVARFGGDEMLIIQKNTMGKSDVENTANKLMSIFDEPIHIRNYEFKNSASIGIVIYPDDGEDSETLLKNADIAMYEAKKIGKNQYIYCSDELKARGEFELKLSNHLNKAIENNELYLLYQPQVNTKTKEIIGVEALLRWDNPELGSISPSVFIPIAERTGLINTIGKWVLKTAIEQNKEWQELGLKAVCMAVNISVNQFKSSNLLKTVRELLDSSSLDAKYLQLELTESILIDEMTDIISTLLKLKELGLSIAIDDFGTGYSSLSRLKELPIDKLKLDIEFVHNLSRSNKDKAIAEVIITLAKQLDLGVIAEGVETKKQLDDLSDMECKEIQGYYFYKPMSSDDISKKLKKYTLEDIKRIN